VAGFDRNGWPTSVGIGGRIASEPPAALRRITQVIRWHHRSGVYGLFNGIHGGSNVVTGGIRLRF